MSNHSGNSFNAGCGKKRCTNNGPYVLMQPATANQWSHNNNYRGKPSPPTRNQNNKNVPYSNTIKAHMDLLYCYSCGYDVDHNGFSCPAPKAWQFPTLTARLQTRSPAPT